MDWKLLATTFGTVFLAELGDKTQLATLTFATTGHSRWAVFIGSAGALVTTSAIAVLAGETLANLIPPAILKSGAGLAFVAIGLWILWTSRGAS